MTAWRNRPANESSSMTVTLLQFQTHTGKWSLSTTDKKTLSLWRHIAVCLSYLSIMIQCNGLKACGKHCILIGSWKLYKISQHISEDVQNFAIDRQLNREELTGALEECNSEGKDRNIALTKLIVSSHPLVPALHSHTGKHQLHVTRWSKVLRSLKSFSTGMLLWGTAPKKVANPFVPLFSPASASARSPWGQMFTLVS